MNARPDADDLATFHKRTCCRRCIPRRTILSSRWTICPPAPAHHPFLDAAFNKVFMGMTTSGKNAEDVLDMCAICSMNISKRTRWWSATATAIRHLSGTRPCCRRAGPAQSAVLCSPFVLGRRNTASTVPTVAQLNAEALSARLCPGGAASCPAIYGHYLSTVSMQSGADGRHARIGLMNFMIGQMTPLQRPGAPPTRSAGRRRWMRRPAMESGDAMAVLLSGQLHLAFGGVERASMHCSMASSLSMSAMHGLPHGGRAELDDFDEALSAGTRHWPRRAVSRPSAHAGAFPARFLHAEAVRQQFLNNGGPKDRRM